MSGCDSNGFFWIKLIARYQEEQLTEMIDS